jgi:hypothetical protein
MNDDDQPIAELREQLRRATTAQLDTSRRRRRAFRLALIPGSLMAGTGIVFATGLIGSPAPDDVQQAFRRNVSESFWGRDPQGAATARDLRLTLVARAGTHALYAGHAGDQWCSVVGNAGTGHPTDGYACEPDTVPEHGGVSLLRLGGGSSRDGNVVTGRVLDGAQTVALTLRSGGSVTATVGQDGFFIAELNDSALGIDGIPVSEAVAKDASGQTVARDEVTQPPAHFSQGDSTTVPAPGGP